MRPPGVVDKHINPVRETFQPIHKRIHAVGAANVQFHEMRRGSTRLFAVGFNGLQSVHSSRADDHMRALARKVQRALRAESC